MPERIASHDPEGIDYGWVLQTTFVLTIVFGVPVIALVSTTVSLQTWGARAQFAVGFGAAFWFVIGLLVSGYAWFRAQDH